ncbi:MULTISPECIES: zinc-binding alcohol dehydrogenase family protein [Streptomyces]|uniref:zinc-binding alcohol dehydrogenase family protein n=1 Tax=Streptomyces TaxID=1883 RepID=UPI001D038342|nr:MULTISPECIES: zinc-binding alcohol dehydrogenase family protein [Streptomyces]
MKAAVINDAGAPPVLADFADPEPVEAESALTVLAAGLHPLVRRLASGGHYGSAGVYPLVPGVDCVAVGSDGAPVYAGFIRAPWGTLAERVAARMGIPLPDGADPVLIAGGLNPAMSGWLPLARRRREVAALGTVLVLGATGVAGRTAVQAARLLGADRVVGVGRDPDRLREVERLGGVPVSFDEGPEALGAALAGTAPSIILDYVWGPPAEAAWAALARRGLHDDPADIVHVQIGAGAGESAALPAGLLRSRRLLVRGSGAGSTSLDAIVAAMPEVMRRLAAGEIVAPVRAFPLSRIADAWAFTGPERAVVVPD